MIKRELLFPQIIANIQDGLSVLDLDLTILWANDVVKSWFSQGFFIEGKKCYEVYYQQDKPCQICPALRCLRSGKMEKIVAPGFNNSCPEWLEISCYPLKKELTAGFIGVVKFIRDITLHKRLERAKRESEEKFRHLFEWASDGIFSLGLNGAMIAVNKKFVELFRINSKEKIISRNIFELVAPGDEPKVRRLMEETLRRGSVSGGEFRACRDDGSEFLAEIDASVLKSASGEESGFIGIIRDITSRKQLEYELQKSHDRLEKMVAERSSRLTELNEQLNSEIKQHHKMATTLAKLELKLRKQKKMLERKNVALQELISQVELEKEKIRNDVDINIRLVIFPILDLIKRGKAMPKMLALLQYHLEKIASSYGRKIYKQDLNLTPKEIEICHMISAGLASKDISSLLNVSLRTVEKHRRNIRRKLGLSRQHINLTSFLRQL